MSPRSRQIEVSGTVEIGGEDVDVLARVEVTPGCAPYWDREFGMMLPGDPMECELLSVIAEDGRDVTALVSERDVERLSEMAADEYESREDAEEAERIDRQIDEAKERGFAW